MLREVFEHAPDAIVIFDDERFLEANPAVRGLLGLAPRELVGRPLEEVLPPEERGRLAARLRRLRAQGTMRVERPLLAADRTRRWVEVAVTANFVPGRHLAIVRDCSQRRSAEAALRRRIVAEALAAEDRTRERISQELHDDLLQSLLVIRQDLAELMAGSGGAGLATRAHAAVERAVASLRAAVSDLHPVVLERGGLAAAVGAVVDHHAGLGGFAASVDVAADAGGDTGRLALSIVRELVANVAGHAAARHVRVRLWREAGRLLLEVADDGRGMDLEAARQGVVAGHIGLASIVQRVEALGGGMTLSSRPGQGTTVRVEIPTAGG